MSSGLPIGHAKYKPYVCDPTKAIATFGDVDFIGCGGQLLVPGVSWGDEPYLEIIEPPCEAEASTDGGGDWLPTAEWTVYQVEPKRCKLVEKDRHLYLVPFAYAEYWPHPVSSYDAWFHDDLGEVASCCGIARDELRANLCAASPKLRAQGYITLASYWWWYEFDKYPLVLSEHEVHQRYGLLDECTCVDCRFEEIGENEGNDADA